jgi:nickel transport protein
MKNRSLTALAAAAALLSAAPATFAHDVWIAPLADGWALRFGHADDTGPVDTTRLRQLAALDRRGQALKVQPVDDQGATRLQVEGGTPVLLTVHLDNGWWSRVAEGSRPQNVAMNQLPAAVSGVHSLKYGKTVLQWTGLATRPQGHALEIVPLQPDPPRAGAALQVQVLHEGRPLAGARVKRGENDPEPLATDGAGRASLTVGTGWQTLIASHRVPLAGDPRAQAVTMSATLVFAPAR